jgi:hypothetical protein
MNADMHNGRGDLSIEWLENQLRSLGGVDPSESLKDRLAADVSRVVAAGPKPRHFQAWSRQMRWVSAAAAVILVAFVVGWLGFLPDRQARPVSESPERAGWAMAADHNSLGTSDTNSYDTNSLR